MEKREFIRRRRRLADIVDGMGVAIIPAAPVRVRNRDVEYSYRPDSDFMYLTGFPEPDAVAVLVPERKAGEYLLFCRERNAEQELWHGRRAGLEGACEIYGADDAFPIDDLDDILPGLLENRKRLYYSMGGNAKFDQRVLGWVNQVRGRARAGVSAPTEIIDTAHIVHEMRLFKSPAELAAMRRAGQISAAAHRRAMQHCKPGIKEYQLEAEILHEFMRSGCRSPAYPSIVGGGANACILHYTANGDALKDGDLVLIDAGGEYEGYAADITRTFPVGGRYSPAQREIYEVVLEAQLAAIAQIKPGNHWNDPHSASVKAITKGLISLGILKGRLPKLIKDEAYKPYFMHRTGHWLGMDVHDVGDYKIGTEWRLLEPGMTLTVEPGLYLPAHSKRLPKRYWDIGIRIEDDVLVTKEGHEVMTIAAPKRVDEIEALMAAGASTKPIAKAYARAA